MMNQMTSRMKTEPYKRPKMHKAWCKDAHETLKTGLKQRFHGLAAIKVGSSWIVCVLK